MNRRALFCAIVVPVVGMMNMGCMPKMTIEDMKAHMPKRPVELDRLNAFVGKWEGEGTATMAMLDEPVTTTATMETKWAGDKWYLVGSGVFSMEGLGDMHGTEIWMYDVKAKKYRSTWVDSMGTIATGESRYNEKTDTWHMRGKSRSPFGKSTMKGTVRFTDDNTMEWTWTEYAMGGLMKTMEMSGTSRRVK